MNKQIATRVKKLLIESLYLRENSRWTIAEYWKRELKTDHNIDAVKISGYELLGYVSQGRLADPESIRRSWQLVQAENPDLRGKNYAKRHKAAEKRPMELREVAKEVSPQTNLLED